MEMEESFTEAIFEVEKKRRDDIYRMHVTAANPFTTKIVLKI